VKSGDESVLRAKPEKKLTTEEQMRILNGPEAEETIVTITF
ncbi:hypothetical protein THOM_2832, partial [Trachipleistophora hominis]